MPNSIIKEVSIYRDSCFITRQGKIKLNKGKQNVTLDILNNNIDITSLSLSLPDNLQGSNVQVEPFNQKEKDEILTDINNRIKEIDNKIAIKQNQIEMWNVNADFSNKENLSIVDMSEYIEKLPERLEKIYKEISELENKKKQLNEEKQDKQIEANSYLVKADIVADEEKEYPFILKYKDYRANWNPMYEIHTSQNDELSILLKARVNQYTKEDFENVKLTLLTSNPNLSSDIPVLNPVELNFYTPRKTMKNTAMFAGTMKMAEESGVFGAADIEPEEIVEYDMNVVSAPVATSNKEDTMTTYDIDGLWNIKDNKEIIIDLQCNNIPCKYHIIAIPKLDDCGYLAANVDINDISEIIDTNANIYHHNTYIGQIYLSVDPDKDTYDISLGKDESIKLKRKQNKKYTSNVLLKGQKKIDYEYELIVNSTKDKKCQVTLLDQVPVSQDKTIVVDLNNTSKAKLDEATGQLSWEFELNEKETKSFDLAYSVSYPKDKKINI